MRRREHQNLKNSAGKVIIGLLIGSVVGATIGWLTAPASGEEMRSRIKGEVKSVRKKAKIVRGNVESRARERELAKDVNENVKQVKKPVTRRKKAAAIRS
jgi:gas vesicle protein